MRLSRSFSIAVLVLLMMGVFYVRFFMGGGPKAPPMGPMPASVAEVLVETVAVERRYSGRVRAVDEVYVKPRVAGVIQAILFQDGAMVDKDAVLFQLDKAPYLADFHRARGQFMAAKAQAEQAKRDLIRAEKLYASRTLSLEAVEQKRTHFGFMLAQQEAAQAQLDFAELSLQYTEIRAPVSGRVGRAEFSVGNTVGAGAGAAALTTVQSVDPVFFDFELDEPTALRVQPLFREGQQLPVRLQISPNGASVEGLLSSLDNRIDPQNGTLRARAQFPNPDGSLLPGAYGHANMIEAKPTSKVLVHDQVIGTDQNKKYVLVLLPDQTTSYRPVRVGPLVNGLRVIEEGLQAGDKVVAGRLVLLRPGMPIIPQWVDMRTLAPLGTPPSQPKS